MATVTTTTSSTTTSNKFVSPIVSVFISLFTVSALYTISNQKELWVLVFLVIALIVVVLEKTITNCCYRREEWKDVDTLTVIQFATILKLTIGFIILKLITDIFLFFIAVTIMLWLDYVNILSVVVGFILFIFARLEF